MKKATFYRIVNRDSVGGKLQITALKTTGYSESDIGLHQENGIWIATHIPTGLALSSMAVTNSRLDETKAVVLANAKRLISERPDYADKLQKHIDSDNHAKFLKSKYDQTAIEVF